MRFKLTSTDMLDASLAALPIAKRMRWGSSDVEFVRPVHWAVFLLGEEVVDTEVLGIKTGRATRGHRFHHPAEVIINKPADYVESLKQAYVLVDQQQRKETVRQQAEACAKTLGGQAVIEESLLDEVTNLVEWPMAVGGCFGAEFLEVPQECASFAHALAMPHSFGNKIAKNH